MEKEKQDVSNEEKKEYKKKLLFCNISEKQIIGIFDSKDKKDRNGEPFKLARIILPNEKFSKKHLGEGATIVVPLFAIADDKYQREGKKVLTLDPKRTYLVHLEKKVGENQYDKSTIEVDGNTLKEAFSLKEREKEKEKSKDIDK